MPSKVRSIYTVEAEENDSVRMQQNVRCSVRAISIEQIIRNIFFSNLHQLFHLHAVSIHSVVSGNLRPVYDTELNTSNRLRRRSE